MTNLDKFTTAIAKRKAWDEKLSRTNVAILMQLQDNDIPRLLEIIRLASGALDKITALGSCEEHHLTAEQALDMWQIARVATQVIEQMAQEGSLSDWGECRPDVH